LEQILPVITRALDGANCKLGDMDAVAVTYGPGLATSLIVGVSMARGLAASLGRPLIFINHVEAHIYACFLDPAAPDFASACPFVALVVSGGHTLLVRVHGVGAYELLGESLDDAAGEAFDKGAKILGLGFPGGPAIDQASQLGSPVAYKFPRGSVFSSRNGRQGQHVDFSYSGLKTALLYHVRDNPPDSIRSLRDVAASFQEAIVASVVERVGHVVKKGELLAVGGGVSLNRRLRHKLREWSERVGVTLLLSSPEFCADNAAMVAGLAYSPGGGLRDGDITNLDVEPNLRLRGT
jgi:N6-L-threonylcarbamoyladenine synthase